MRTKKVVAIVVVLIVSVLVISGIQGGQALAQAPVAAPHSSMEMHQACATGDTHAMHEHCGENGAGDHGDRGGDRNIHHTGKHGH